MFEVLCDGHFSNYSIYRSVVIATVKVGVVNFPKIFRCCHSNYKNGVTTFSKILGRVIAGS